MDVIGSPSKMYRSKSCDAQWHLPVISTILSFKARVLYGILRTFNGSDCLLSYLHNCMLQT